MSGLILVLAAIYEAALRYWYVPVAVAMAAIRISGHKSEAFQATAHLLVGGLFVAGRFGERRGPWITAILLSLIELACFLVGLVAA